MISFTGCYFCFQGQPLAKIIVQDEKDQKHRLEIVSDGSKLFTIQNGYLVANKKIDFEKEPKRKFTLQIKATDDGIGYLVVRGTKFS